MRVKYFHEELRQLRKSLNLTQKNVADALGIVSQSYYAYEAGVAMPTLENFIKLCDFFDVTPNYLLKYTE